MKHKGLSLVLAVALVVIAFGALPASRAFAAGTIDFYPTLLPADTTSTDCSTGTPYAIHVNFSGLTAANTYTIKAYHYLSSGDTANRGCMWNFQTNSWTAIDNNYNNLPTITGVTDWAGWLYLKEVTNHAGLTSATNLRLRVRFRTGATNMDATISAGLVAGDMSGTCTTNCGGWLEETNGFSRAGRAYVVKNGATIVGMYVSEDNGVNEGYPATVMAAAAPAAAGYSKVAVPACTTCNYTVESWDLAVPGTAVGRVNVMGSGACPNGVAAGGVTSLDTCNAPTAVTLRMLSAGPQTLPAA